MNPEWEFARIYEAVCALRKEITEKQIKLEQQNADILYKLEKIETILNPPPFSSSEIQNQGIKILKDRAKIWDNQIDKSKYGSLID